MGNSCETYYSLEEQQHVNLARKPLPSLLEFSPAAKHKSNKTVVNKQMRSI